MKSMVLISTVSASLATMGVTATSATAALYQPPAATAAQPSEALRTRANQMVELLNDKMSASDLFTADFLKDMPADDLNRVLTRLRGRFGSAKSVDAIEASTPHNGVVTFDMENGKLRLLIGVADTAPHAIDVLRPGGRP